MFTLPNSISLIRIIFAIGLIFVKPFSALFYLIYFLGGISDFLDGYIARKYKLVSDLGALLDSISDLIFILVILIICLNYFTWSLWMVYWIIVITLIRFVSIGVGYYRYKTLSTLHTMMNKLSGFTLFIFPMLYLFIPFYVLIIIICSLTSLSAIEELLINIISKQLNRNIPSILSINDQ